VNPSLLRMLSFQPYFTVITEVWRQGFCKLVLLKTLSEAEIAAAVVAVAARLQVTVFCQVLQLTKLPSWLLCTGTIKVQSKISSWKPHVHILVLR
jgi:hypothetical protein